MRRSLTTASIYCWLPWCIVWLLLFAFDDKNDKPITLTATTALSLDSPSTLTVPRQQQSQQKRRRRPIQRVAIIGSGIAGLSVAHALSNSPALKKSAQESIAAAAAVAAASGASGACGDVGVGDDEDNRSLLFPEFEVSMFDSRTSFDTKTGAGVQLNGGLSVLQKINPNVLQAVMDAGLPQTKLTSKCRRWPKDNNSDSADDSSDTTGNDFPMDTLLELDIRQIVENAGKSVTQSLLLQDNNDGKKSTKLLWIAIMRNSIQQALLDTLPRDVKNRLYYGKYLTNIQTNKNDGAYCEFADGTMAGPFDLIVGCDGIQSACKEFIERGKISTSKTNDESSAKRRQGSAAGGAIYSGVRIKYAVRDGKPDDNEQPQQQPQPQPAVASLSQSFGNGAYVFKGEFGAGAKALPTKCTYLVYQDPDYFGPVPRRKDNNNNKEDNTVPQAVTTRNNNNNNNLADENADWTQNIPKSDLQAARDKMTQQAHDAKIDIGPIVATADRIFELGVYFHNPFSCTGWSKEYINNNDSNGDGTSSSSCCSSTVVLCGDAAHAMPPFLGQGANQAIQDAYCLATKLYDYNVAVATEHYCNVVQDQQEGENDTTVARSTGTTPTTLRSLLQEYERIRWAATFQIFWKSVFLGYLETGGNDGLYAKFRDVFFKTMGIIGFARIILLSAAVPKV